MNLTGCEIRFVLFGPDGRVTEWSLTRTSHKLQPCDVGVFGPLKIIVSK